MFGQAFENVFRCFSLFHFVCGSSFSFELFFVAVVTEQRKKKKKNNNKENNNFYRSIYICLCNRREREKESILAFHNHLNLFSIFKPVFRCVVFICFDFFFHWQQNPIFSRAIATAESNGRKVSGEGTEEGKKQNSQQHRDRRHST